MLRSVVASASFAVLIGSSFLLTFTSVGAVTGNTEVQTVLCDGSATASLMIDVPDSDSVLTTMPFAISGTVNNVTQIDITVDGGYAGTIPISANDDTFASQFTIPEGTHTVVLTGNDVCQVQNPSDTVVLTYSPANPPSNGGGSTPPITITPGGTGTIDGEPVTQRSESGIEQMPVVGDLVAIGKEIAKALDFDATAKDGGLAVTVARFAAFTLGLGLMVFASGVLHAVRVWRLRELSVHQYITGKKLSISDPNLKEHIHRNIFIVRSIGAVILVAAFWL